MAENKVSLRTEDEEDIKRAAIFVAQLVREGVTFNAHDDIVGHPSGLRSAPGLVVTLTGGF